MDSNSKRTLRSSIRIPTPEKFITKEIQNQTAKQKNSHHRRSVLNELRATENLLNDSLNKNIRHNYSGFLRITEAPGSEKSFKLIAKSASFSKNRLSKEGKEEPLRKKKSNPQKNFRISSEIGQKLKQLINISYQFEKACENKKPTKFKCQTQANYSLPAIEEDPAMVNQEISQKEKQKWNQKLKLGRKCIQLMKQKPTFCTPMQRKRQQPLNANKEDGWKVPQTLKFRFLKPNNPQRETIPVSKTTNSFYHLFVKEKSSHQPQRRLQLQPLLALQQFATGGEPSLFSEHSNHLNLKEFMQQKQKFKFLKKVYNYVKENCLQTRYFSQDDLEQTNLLSLVYYMENASNLTEYEKKSLRKRFKFIQ